MNLPLSLFSDVADGVVTFPMTMEILGEVGNFTVIDLLYIMEEKMLNYDFQLLHVIGI